MDGIQQQQKEKPESPASEKSEQTIKRKTQAQEGNQN